MSLKGAGALMGVMGILVIAQSHGADAQTGNAYDVAQHCYTACHGGASLAEHPDWPSISGQKVEYTVKQLRDFRRAGQDSVHMKIRTNPHMDSEAAALDEDTLGLVAEIISNTPCEAHPRALKPPRPMPQAAAQCVGCHGADGRGLYRHIPVLAGQSTAYLQKQLAALKTYQPHTHEHQIGDMRHFQAMAEHTASVPDATLREIADYYSSLPCK